MTALVELFAPEAKGHGVPEVMDAVYACNSYVPTYWDTWN